MPEGDILRRTARSLDRALTGSILVRSELRWPSAASVDLTGATVVGTEAYGKHLFIRFDDGRSLHTHLRMEGSWRLARTGSAGSAARDPFVRAVLASAAWTAIGDRLGMLGVLPTRDEHTVIAHLGPDVLADTFPHVRAPDRPRRVRRPWLDARRGGPARPDRGGRPRHDLHGRVALRAQAVAVDAR